MDQKVIACRTGWYSIRSQHLEQARFAYDTERSKYFESLGYKAVRFWNNQVDGVIRAIEIV